MLDAIKKFAKGFRTALIGAAMAAVGFLEGFDYINIIPEGYEAIAVGINGLIMIGLRYITDSPMFKKDNV